MAQPKPHNSTPRNPRRKTPTSNHIPNRNTHNTTQPPDKPDKTKPKLENTIPKPERNKTRKNSSRHNNNPAAKNTNNPMHTHNKPNRHKPRTGNPHKQKNPRNSHKQNQIDKNSLALRKTLSNSRPSSVVLYSVKPPGFVFTHSTKPASNNSRR